MKVFIEKTIPTRSSKIEIKLQQSFKVYLCTSNTVEDKRSFGAEVCSLTDGLGLEFRGLASPGGRGGGGKGGVTFLEKSSDAD
jgi:hypothetical protein